MEFKERMFIFNSSLEAIKIKDTIRLDYWSLYYDLINKYLENLDNFDIELFKKISNELSFVRDYSYNNSTSWNNFFDKLTLRSDKYLYNELEYDLAFIKNLIDYKAIRSSAFSVLTKLDNYFNRVFKNFYENIDKIIATNNKVNLTFNVNNPRHIKELQSFLQKQFDIKREEWKGEAIKEVAATLGKEVQAMRAELKHIKTAINELNQPNLTAALNNFVGFISPEHALALTGTYMIAHVAYQLFIKKPVFEIDYKEDKENK